MTNPIVPRDLEVVGRERNREEFLKGKTLLVPELVRVHPVPASLWRECMMFPFVVQRVQGSKCQCFIHMTSTECLGFLTQSTWSQSYSKEFAQSPYFV